MSPHFFVHQALENQDDPQIFVLILSWLYTPMMENRVTLKTSELDGFDKVSYHLMLEFVS